ncbi:ABC transporter substrate-binding protein [Niveibacterium umoris]|uniref:Oligopeptide transport system substrate-binding protein n=1 Tax=Niveibacterium umoris TaxID=1193620 RepID=A0A840BQA7_9RHOO|nr:peptide ABC transporter substrate-binding protein [Niveibacterium umoris]MBB4013016.1 oligopeptide transport system substrate-binding protein [Niveibacterium umoris]
MRMTQRLALAACLVAGSAKAFAAEVPAGTPLHPVQEIVRGNGTEPATLDPNKSEGRPESNMAVELFEGLVSLSPDGKVIPGVAEKWESREGGKVWLFTLRKAAKWSDGSPVTAHDFEYSFKRMVDPKTASQYAWYLGKASNVKNGRAIVEGKVPPSELGVKALGEHTLQITLEKPVSYLIATLAHGSLMPVPRKAIEKYGDKWTEPGNMISNGAYKLAERVVNERIVMLRNPHYWNNAKTVIDKVTFLPINNQSAEYQRYRANGIDMTADGGVPPEQLKQIRRDIPNELVTWPQLGTYCYVFNFRKKPFDDVRVRKALSLALQREVIAQKLVGTGETPAYSFTPETAEGYTPIEHDWQRWTQAQREEEARRLLAEAGYTKARPLRFELLYNTNEGHKKIALAAAWMWRRIGPVEVVLVNQEWKTFLDSRNRGQFEVSRYAWIADYNEPSTMLDLFHSQHGNNDGKYNNPQYDAIMDRAKSALDAAERTRLYQDAERILAQDFPTANVYHYSNRHLIKPWVKGYGHNPEGRILTRDLYIVAH